MGIVNKQEVLYMSTGIDVTGLKEGKQEMLDVLQSLMQEASAMDAFGGISMAAAAAFTQAAAGLSGVAQEFDRLMADMANRFPELSTELEMWQEQILALATDLPVGAVECAGALEQIIVAGKRGTEVMEALGEAARRAVLEAKGISAVLEQSGERGQAGDSSAGLQAAMGTAQAQMQLLQNRMLVMLRPLGEQLLGQVSTIAAGLGQTLAGGNIGGSLQELDTLITLAAVALRDYKTAVKDNQEALNAEAAALDMAIGIRQAYRQVVENGVELREEELLQQAAYRSSLAETTMQEEEMNGAKLAFTQQALGAAQQLSNIVAEEVMRINRKKQAYAEELQTQQALLEAAEKELSQAGEVREARQKEYDLLKWENDQTAAALANTRLQEAAGKEMNATIEAENARREVRNAQLKLETANRQAATASTIAGTAATGGSVAVDTAAAASTTLLARAKQAATVATRSLTAALAANPLGMVLTVVSLAISAFSAFGKETGKTADEQERLNEALQKQGEHLRNLNSALFNESEEDTARAEALLKLKELLPQVYGKVELANLAEQDRNRLLKEGNRELNRRKELELEAMQVASRRRIEELKKPAVRMGMPVTGGLATNGVAVGVGNSVALEKELARYQKIGAELKHIRELNVMTGDLGLTKDQRLERYKNDLKELKERLGEVNAALELMTGGKAGQMDFNPAIFPEITGLLTEKGQIEEKISSTEGYIQKAGKKENSAEDVLRRRQQMEQQLTGMVEQMMLRRQKETILTEKQGIAQRLELIELEYRQRAKEIAQKEQELKALYKNEGDASEGLGKIEKLKADNEEQRRKEIARAEAENDAEVKRHITEQGKAFLSAEEQKVQAIDDRYRKELVWAEKNKEAWQNPDDYTTYTGNLKKNRNAEKLSVMLPDLRDYAAELEGIERKWNSWISKAEENNDLGLKTKLEAGRNNEISKVRTDKIISSEEWASLFSDLDELTVREIDQLIATIQERMNEAELLPVDRNALIKNLNEAKQQIVSINPFHALGTSFEAVFAKSGKDSEKNSKEIQNNWQQLGKSTQGCFDFINDAISSCSVLGDLLGESGQASMAMIQGVATAGIAMATAMKKTEDSSVVLIAVSAALQVVTALFSMFNKDNKKEAKIQGLQVEVEKLERAYDKLGGAIENTYSDQVLNMMDRQNDNLRQQQELIRQQIAAEQGKKKTDQGKIRDWQNQIEDIDRQLEENQRKRIEMLAGTDIKSAIDEFADALVEAYAKGEGGAVALAETTKKVMANAVKEALKRRFLGEQIEAAVKYLGDSMEDGKLTDSEKVNFQQMVNAAGERFSEALKVYDDLFAGEVGANGSGISGQLQEAMTEGTASQLVGLWNMTANDIRSVRNLTAEQLTLCSMMNMNVGEVLRQQFLIEYNTRRTADNTAGTLEELRSGFGRMDNRLKTIDENTRGYAGRGKR